MCHAVNCYRTTFYTWGLDTWQQNSMSHIKHIAHISWHLKHKRKDQNIKFEPNQDSDSNFRWQIGKTNASNDKTKGIEQIQNRKK